MAIQVAPENVIGRDELIAKIWKRLAKKSIRFTAERRVGKTTVMTKMTAEPEAGFEVLFLELEGIDSPDRFAELLLNRVTPLLSKTDAAKGWWTIFRDSIGGTEIAGVFKLPESNKMGWQTTVEKTLEGACTHNSDKTIVLLMDELPYMLQKIASIEADGQQKTLALTLLDTLRSIRQKHSNVRMVYAGSVGLHHVVTDLKQSKLASEPLNDMPIVEIRALSEPDAITLTARLLSEEGVELAAEDGATIHQRIANRTDCVPFYIEAVCSRLGEQDGPIDSDDVDRTVREQLASDHDPWEMEHFRERLETYYSGTVQATSGGKIRDEEIARAILDHLALVDEPRSIEQIWSAVKAQFKIADRQHIVGMLKSLALDHYLISDTENDDTEKRYSFRFPLIRGWWRTAQGLES